MKKERRRASDRISNQDFLILQALEILYRQQWTAMDELGVLIISPTRELAYQTFEVLRKVGKNHEFSAGLIIGGKVGSPFKK